MSGDVPPFGAKLRMGTPVTGEHQCFGAQGPRLIGPGRQSRQTGEACQSAQQKPASVGAAEQGWGVLGHWLIFLASSTWYSK